jgi:Domain of unknown function (DUF1905)
MAVKFAGTVRQWDSSKPGGLNVVDVPDELVPDLGARRQMRVTCTINGASFAGSTMLVAGGWWRFLCRGEQGRAEGGGASVGDLVELGLAS